MKDPAKLARVDGENVVLSNGTFFILAAVSALLQSERAKVWEEAAKIAFRERVNADETGEEGDRAYNQACDDIFEALRGSKEKI
jgi:hypothetical protein